MPLMTREDKALYDILKKHDENNLMMKVKEEDFSILNDQQKEKYAADIVHLLTERTYPGTLLGYKSLEDRKKEIDEANKAAMEERAHPDPSFNAPGMDNLYTALKKENNIEKYPDFPSENEFKQMKLDEKIKLTEELIEGSTDLSIRGYAYDAAASIVGAEQYGTKAEREKALYDAAKALDPMIEEYQERNPEAPEIFQYNHRKEMDQIYGTIYADLKAHEAKELPSRGIFYAMNSKERLDLLAKLTPEESYLDLNGGFSPNKDRIMNETPAKLKAADEELNIFALKQWAAQDKLYGKIYTDLQAHSANSKDLPSRGEFFRMTTDKKKELVENITPEDSKVDLNGGFSPKEDEKNRIIELIEAISPRDTSPERSVNYADPTETIIEPEIPPTKPSMHAQQDNGAPNIQEHKRKNLPPKNYVYIDVESGDRIALEHVRTKEGIEFHYPAEPKDNIITEKGNEKEGYRFESTQEAIDRGENITIETPCLDENGVIIPNKFEKLIFNPKTNEMLLHKVPAGHQSRLDQTWLSEFEDKTPKSQSIVRTRVPQEDPEAIERNQEQEEQRVISPVAEEMEVEKTPISATATIVEQEIEAEEVDENTPESNIDTAQRLVDEDVIPKLRKATTPASPAAQITPSFTVRCPGENGMDLELERNTAGHFINKEGNVIVEVDKNGKDFKVLGQGEVFIDRPRTNPQYTKRDKYFKGELKQQINVLEPQAPVASSFSSVSASITPAITPNITKTSRGGYHGKS